MGCGEFTKNLEKSVVLVVPEKIQTRERRRREEKT